MNADLALDSSDYKNTQKITWLTNDKKTTPTLCYHYDNVITKAVLKPDDDFKDYLNYNSMVTIATVVVMVTNNRSNDYRWYMRWPEILI